MKLLKKQIYCFLAANTVFAAVSFAQAPFFDESEERAFVHEESSETQNLSNNVDILNKIQGLQQDIQELRGQLELQHHQIELLKQNAATTVPVTAASRDNVLPQEGPHTLGLNAEGEKTAYQAAYDFILTRQYAEALPAMESFLKTYPKSGYAANAHYWIGELYMVQKNYPQAIHEFETVLKSFPASSKASASLLKMGYALAASGDREAAKVSLKAVVKQYPDTHAAQLALAKLDTMNQ